MQRRAASLTAAIAAAVAATHLQAAEIYWQGGTGNLTDFNYTDGTNSNLAPMAADGVNIGNAGTVSNALDVTIDSLRLGHNEPTLPGAGTLNLTGGTLTLSGAIPIGTAPTGTAIVGSGETGTLNLSGGSMNLTSGAMFVGYASGNGTLQLSSGTLTLTDNRLGIGEGGAGSVIVSGGTLQTLGTGTTNGDMIVGVNTTSSFSQSAGTVSLGRDLIVGRRTADATTFSITGGSFTARDLSLADDGSPGNTTDSDSGDNVSVSVSDGSLSLRNAFIGRNLASGTSITIADDLGVAGTTSFSTTADFELGLDGATNTTATISGGDVNIGNNLFVAGGTTTGTTLNVSGGNVNIGTVDASGGTFDLGRGGSDNTTFNLSGGTVTVVSGVDASNNPAEGIFNLATQTGPNAVPAPVNVVTHHTGGTLNARGVVVGENLGGSTTPGSNNATYNLSDNGILNVSSHTIIGRRLDGTMNQTGGTANLGNLSIGNNEGASTDPNVSGVYNISGGALNANSIALAPNGTDALPAGTAELNVSGDDSIISVTGNFSSSSAGTLAFLLESGESLSLIDVDGAATFDLGAALVFDDSNAAPSLSSYDLLTATSIADNGIAFTGPTGWSYQIVSGGNGQILQVVVPEPGVFGLVAMAGLTALARRRRRA